jgi:hypothetical protein
MPTHPGKGDFHRYPEDVAETAALDPVEKQTLQGIRATREDYRGRPTGSFLFALGVACSHVPDGRIGQGGGLDRSVLGPTTARPLFPAPARPECRPRSKHAALACYELIVELL